MMAGKIRSSRILKITLIVVAVLVVIWGISTGMIFYLTCLAAKNNVTEGQLALIQSVAELLKVDIVGAITTVVSFCIARYGLRETTANLKGIKYNTTEETSAKE